MTDRLLKAMKLIVEWDNQEKICHSLDGIGCENCPYELGKSCDRVSTTYVLTQAAKVFREELK